VRARVRFAHRTVFAAPARFCILLGMRRDDRPANAHLPPHLREVCEILARGLLRLRSRSIAAINVDVWDGGESSLHSTAHQRRYANPEETEDA
jgi:hypothetical protein